MAIEKQANTDSINIDKQLKYQKDGLTSISNNESIMPRDANGNIILQQDGTANPLLIIEPTANKITNKSMMRILDTQFKYFKFPPRTTIVDEEPVDLDLDLDLQSLDATFARYRPSEDQKIPASTEYSGIEISEVQDGILQQSPNTYTITKDLKNSGVDLRFRIKLQHRYDAPSGYGTAYFSIIRASEEGLNREYRTFENTSNLHPTVPGSINQYEVQNLEIDIVIPNSEFEIGDRFGIGAKAGQNNDTQYHTINALQSYWVITDASKNVDLWNQEIQINIESEPARVEIR
jgi:hypothetical protein